MASNRPFRSTESYTEEAITRDLLPQFLSSRGFTEISDHRQHFGNNVSQSITAFSPTSERVVMRVKLAWRKENKRESLGYSAAQLMASVEGNRWVETLMQFVERMRSKGATHLLVAQRVQRKIVYAALIAVDEVVPVWVAQREESRRLLQIGALGRRHKNHAENGGSPTLWLEDQRAPSISQTLWKHAGVTNLLALPSVESSSSTIDDDSQADLPGVDTATLGRDEAHRYRTEISGIGRDPKVRQQVLERAGRTCERPGCAVSRSFTGFLDVHHILGAEKSDRVWTCVALCPNCHREAHFSPERDALNSELLALAFKFKSSA